MDVNKLLLTAAAVALFSAGCANNQPMANSQAGNNFGDQQHHQMRDGDKKEHPMMNQDPKMKEAMDECMKSATKDANGRPDREAMQSCMKEKGFEPPQRPEGRPPHENGEAAASANN